MSISANICKFRKSKGYTQEKLGELLGVSNQAVSKWESEVSMPDILLLPKIAEALGITLNDLYGIETAKTEDKVKADDFPFAMNNNMIEFFYRQAGGDKYFSDGSLQYTIDEINKGWIMTCISDTCGAVYVSRDFSFAELDYKTPDSEKIFGINEVVSAMKKLSDGNVRKILMYMYKASFSDSDTCNRSFLLTEITEQCGSSEDDALEAIEKLCVLRILETYVNSDHMTEYVFLKQRVIYALCAFKCIELMTKDPMWHIVRDTSVISDYAFEKLW